MLNIGKTTSQGELAKRLGVSTHDIGNLKHQHGLTNLGEKAGKYIIYNEDEVEAIITAYAEYAKNKATKKKLAEVDGLLTTTLARRKLGIGSAKLLRLHHQGHIPAKCLNGRYLFDPKDLDTLKGSDLLKPKKRGGANNKKKTTPKTLSVKAKIKAAKQQKEILSYTQFKKYLKLNGLAECAKCNKIFETTENRSMLCAGCYGNARG